ncbi:MAG: CocE/NonD family hydrolase [Planctomycetes bacterium]|nr:CocE/NonD family hydrolase [Planctomycetota bacterium]
MRPILPVLLAAALLPAQGVDHLRAHYTKREVLVPMRDGTRLFTAIYQPKDQGQRWPILLRRTPYGVPPYGAEAFPADLGPSPRFGRDGFVFVYQDVRGRKMSEGEFVNVRPFVPAKTGRQVDESSDTYDTIEWLLANVPGHNGRVGIWGISYPGFYASMAAIEAHPALVAASPQAPVADWFVGDDFRHHGALFLQHAFTFLSGFGRPRTGPTTESGWPSVDTGTGDGYRFFLELGPLANVDQVHFRGQVAFWNELLDHDTYDAFWRERCVLPHLRAIRPATLVVGGWFDAEDLYGALETYRAIERQSPATDNRLVMGPWVHGGWARGDGDALGDVRFGAKTARFYQDEIEFPFFAHHLKGAPDPRLPEAWMFATGENRWHALEAWPPRDARPIALHFRAGGRLALAPPEEESEAFDAYLSDPARPVPHMAEVGIGMAKEYMVADQRFAARRPDVLVYESEALQEPLTLAGPLRAVLHVSTSGTDSDWVVKLIDVYPGDAREPGAPAAASRPANPASRHTRMGHYQQLVRGEPFRGRFRNSYERPEAFLPGQPAKVEFSLPDVFHTFLGGHRIQVQVQSSWFPLVDRNPQTFVPIGRARAEDFRPATQRVFRDAARPSRLEARVRGG